MNIEFIVGMIVICGIVLLLYLHHGFESSYREIKEYEDNTVAIRALCDNLKRVFNKMHRKFTPGNDEHSEIIDLINHADTLVQQIERETSSGYDVR